MTSLPRRIFASLTTRGRSLLVAGIACMVAAVPLAERDLLRVGSLLLVLPLISAAVVARTRFRIVCLRSMHPSRVPAGAPAQVDLLIRNDARLPTTLLLLEDQVPYALGARPRFVITRLESGGSRRVSYRASTTLRGRYRIGPLAVRLTDPFGCVEMAHEFASHEDLIVHPSTVVLPQLALRSQQRSTGEQSARVLAAVGEVDVGTRTYRHGDDLRKVHWRSTARTGELMVRQEQAGHTSRVGLLLDTRSTAHRGDSVTGSFEWAVSAAASVVVHLARRELVVDLMDGGAPVHSSGLGATMVQSLLLDRMAEVALTPRQTLAADILRARARATECGELFVVLGELKAEDIHGLIPLAAAVPAAHALLLDVGSWGGDGEVETAARTQLRTAQRKLAAAGWRVAIVQRGDRLEDAWLRLGAAR